MTTTQKHDDQIACLVFAKIYPMYVAKIEKKERTVTELIEVITWLTGYSEDQLQLLIANQITMKEFFAGATINPNAHLIKGKICGYQIEDIQTPTTQQIRYLDKLVDELAKGRKMEKILRKS
ncbi:DUF2200 domain-containing protein [Shewanella sp. 202IG2-18]|uniref:DUF2200 domain-containing protein n=1 Tax=Parashewanella hymeniacidonis TaxID=2807618 RepID=UPI00196000C6|nr:DUF2200 domain-containing protein [Parashewanella hymeniacidonis]MBM7074223.1 DUF2200 domain-containing protein [Parashewanella hymeniacidonis]